MIKYIRPFIDQKMYKYETLKSAVHTAKLYGVDNENRKCPICGKEKVLIPYMCGGSILSGNHTIQFYCTNCNEQFVTNDYIEYFRKIYRYAKKHRNELPNSPKFIECTKI